MSRLGAPSSPNRRMCWRSLSGTPRMSLITATGSCEQYRSTMSTTSSPDSSASLSSSSSAVCCTRSRSALTARVVNTEDTNLRQRVWSGGSIDNSDGGSIGCNSPGLVFSLIQRSGVGRPAPSDETRKSSERSSSLATRWSTVISTARHRTTGPWARSSSANAAGSARTCGSAISRACGSPLRRIANLDRPRITPCRATQRIRWRNRSAAITRA